MEFERVFGFQKVSGGFREFQAFSKVSEAIWWLQRLFKRSQGFQEVSDDSK